MNKQKKVYWAIALAVLVVCLGAVYFGGRQSLKSIGGLSAQKPALTVDERVDQIVSKMSDGEKIGQMMMIGVKGTEVNSDMSYLLGEYHMGGIILFDRNMETKEQVLSLTTGLQKQALQNGKLPLLVGVDEEGGPVARMRQSLTVAPAAATLGRQGDAAQAGEWAKRTAVELKELGINLNFAPVADIGSADQRSYSKNPQIVSEFVRQAAAGYSQEGMLFSLKHFPGIGKGKVDSHVDAYRIPASRSTLDAEDFVPFRQMIGELNPESYMIMVSHLTYPALDNEHPASLSSKIITGLLKEQMGFQGIAITDDLEMGAVSKYYSFNDLGVKAVQAGADMVLVCHEYEHEIAVYNGLLKALQNGELDRQQIDNSVRKIVKMKLTHLVKP